MDSVTQIVLGAAVGELVAGKKAGNKALLWGAIAGTIPDLDVIPGQFLDTVTRLEIHRGFSHSLLFAFTASPIFGWLVAKIHKKTNPDWKLWAKLFFWGIITHFLLDSFTTWGTQVFYPFEYRVDWNTIFVIDPLYTLPFLLAIIVLAFFNRESVWRRRLNYIGLGISSLYLFITVINKNVANSHFEAELDRQNIEYSRYSSRPSPLNSILWTANIESKDISLEDGIYELSIYAYNQNQN